MNQYRLAEWEKEMNKFRLAEMERRLANLIQVGRICEVWPEDALCRVDFGTRKSPMLPYFTPRAGQTKEYFHPDTGEQCLVFCPHGDERWGFVLVGIFSADCPVPSGSGQDIYIKEFPDGTRILYNRAKHILDITVNGDTKISIGGNADVDIGGQANINVSKDAHIKSDGHLDIEAKNCISFKCAKHGGGTI
jgi:phage baseplate assembly protein V